MQSPSSIYSDSVYSESVPSTPALASPESPFNSYNRARMQAFGAQREVLTSMITGEEITIGRPSDSPLCQRRMAKKVSIATAPADLSDAASGEVDAFAPVNWDGPKQPVDQFDLPPLTPSSTHSSLDLLLPKFNITEVKKPINEVTGIDDEPQSESSSLLAPSIPLSPSPHLTVASIASLARFVEREAPGMLAIDTDDDDSISEAVIEEATIAMPIPVPARGRSLLNLRVLEAGVASRSRRPIMDDSSDSESDTSSLLTHHTNLIPTTFETGTARAVRLYRPPPVKLIVVRGRVVAMNQAEAAEVNAPWETASVLGQHGETGCAGQTHLWAKIKRKFHRD